MNRVAIVLLAIPVAAGVYWALEHSRFRVAKCPSCKSRIAKGASVCAKCGRDILQ